MLKAFLRVNIKSELTNLYWLPSILHINKYISNYPKVKTCAPMVKNCAPMVKNCAPMVKTCAPMVKTCTPRAIH